MTMHLQLMTNPPWGTFADVNMSETGLQLTLQKLIADYTGPTQLTFRCHAAQHTDPVGRKNAVRCWDDSANHPFNGNPQSSSNPLFIGYIESCDPGSHSNEVQYVAYDPTFRASRTCTLMNLGYVAGDIGSRTEPSIASGALPRLVYNSTIDNDDDYAYCQAWNVTLGTMIANVLDNCYQQLYWNMAAPGDGTNAGNDTAYLSTDLATTLTYEPQEKQVFDSLSPRAACDQLLKMAPTWRMIFDCSSRRWRFGDLTSCPQVTLNLNSNTDTYRVLDWDLRANMDDRRTAVHFFGPETNVYAVASVSGGSLTQIDSGVSLEGGIGGVAAVPALMSWQIADPTKRAVSRVLPFVVLVQTGPYSMVGTRWATFQAYWANSSPAGPAGWQTINGWQVDTNSGLIWFQGAAVYRYNQTPGVNQPHYENPDDVQFIYSYLSNPLQIRYPTSGYAGAAYTIAGISGVMMEYDESLAVGWENFRPVTSANRVAQFNTLAQYMHALHSDIGWIGTTILEGCQYDFAMLNRRINFTGTNPDGASVTTGWESINAYLTHCEIDFEQQTTTLQYSSDQMDVIGMDPDMAKRYLQIRQLTQVNYTWVGLQTSIRERSISDPVTGFDQFNHIIDQTITVESGTVYVDPRTGVVDTGSNLVGPANTTRYVDQHNVSGESAVRGYLKDGSIITASDGTGSGF